jgi:hypothetical protein
MRSGKDTLADILVAEHGFRKVRFAATLYQLWTICSNTQGTEAIDRRLKMVHNCLHEFSQKAGIPIPYETLVDTTREIVVLGSQISSGDSPSQVATRDFLQQAGFHPGGLLGQTGWFPMDSNIAATMYDIRRHLIQQMEAEEALADQQDHNPRIPSVVISDVRFPKEVIHLQKWGAEVFLLNPPYAVRRERMDAEDFPGEEGMTHMSEASVDSIIEMDNITIISSVPELGELPAQIRLYLRGAGVVN